MDSASFTSYEKMTAANFSLSKEVLEDPRNIAASDRSDFSESDNQMILQFLALKNNTSLFREGKPGSYMEAIISELGVDGKQAKVFEENQTNLSMVIQNQRLSVSGVNLDEEIASLMKFQHAYNAAAKMISVFDEIYNTTINNMGAR